MADDVIQIRRYPNRRFYSRDARKYVSLEEIEQLVREGRTIDVTDSQTGESLTRTVLAQIITDRQPDKMSLFPVDMLHAIVRANDAVTGFLRDYFRQSLTYLDYLQKHGTTARELASPIHWMKLWLDGIKAPASAVAAAVRKATANESSSEPADDSGLGSDAATARDNGASDNGASDDMLARIAVLEARIRQLESRDGT